MNFEAVKARRDEIDAANREHSKALNAFPRMSNGLTPDNVKFSPAYRAAKAEYDASAEALRRVNIYLNKYHAKELRADRAAKRKSLETV